MHLECLRKQMGLVTHALPETLELGPIEVVRQDGLVVGVGTLLDNHAGAFAGREATDVGETLVPMLAIRRKFSCRFRAYLFGNDHVEIMLRLIDMSAHRHDARHTGRIGLAGSSTGGMHDTVLR